MKFKIGRCDKCMTKKDLDELAIARVEANLDARLVEKMRSTIVFLNAENDALRKQLRDPFTKSGDLKQYANDSKDKSENGD